MARLGERPVTGLDDAATEETADLKFDDSETGLARLSLVIETEAAVQYAEILLSSALEHLEHGNLGLAHNEIRNAERALAGIELVNGSRLLADRIEEVRAQIAAAVETAASDWPMPPPREDAITLEIRRNRLDEWEAGGGQSV